MLDGLGTLLNNLLCVAFEEDFADKFILWTRMRLLCVWEVPGRMESLGQSEMLLSDDSTADSLILKLAPNRVGEVGDAYRSKQSSHETITFLSVNCLLYLEHARR